MKAADGRTLLVSLQAGGSEAVSFLIVFALIYVLMPAIILLPPSFLIGFYFPIVQKAVQTDTHVVGQRVGLIDVSNIIGNTAGSILTGTLLLNTIGTVNTLRLIALLGLIFIAVLLYENRSVFRVIPKVTGGLLAAGLAVGMIAYPPALVFWARMHGAEPGRFFDVAEDSSGVSAVREDVNGLVDIWANGRAQGGIAPFDSFHSFLGVLPLAMHPNPARIMVVGIGSGNTPYAVGASPKTERIDAVEIIGSELPVLESFAKQERGRAIRTIFDDKRYNLIVGDGRREIVLSKTPFDVIVVDAVLPWTSHAGLLYSREFFETTRSRLAEGGLMVQWRPTARSEATFLSVFPYTLVIADIVMIGSNTPITYDPQAVLKRLLDPQMVAYLKAGGVDAESMRYWIETEPYTIWTPDTPRPNPDINTDLFPKDEHYLNNALGPIHYPRAGGKWFTYP
jgi:predicted membrane-bound spermidine synthase